jgi:gamma-glutamyltranspeptidase/glutathione hydrolase
VTAEAMRRAFADRNHFLGDPAFVHVPRDRLVSQAYADRLRATIDRTRATPSLDIRPGLGQGSEPEHTTHFSVVDAHGNAVALTTTLNELFGSAVTVTGAGFLLNDEMDDFAAKPGTPNLFGLVQGEANAIQPERRMLSAMTPTIVLDRDGRVLMVTGARGGPRIITAVFQVISNVIDYDMDVARAVRAPRIHHQHLPDVLYYERNGLSADVLRALEALGHHVEMRGTVGTAPTILRRGSVWTGVADPRTGGAAAGY